MTLIKKINSMMCMTEDDTSRNKDEISFLQDKINDFIEKKAGKLTHDEDWFLFNALQNLCISERDEGFRNGCEFMLKLTIELLAPEPLSKGEMEKLYQ